VRGACKYLALVAGSMHDNNDNVVVAAHQKPCNYCASLTTALVMCRRVIEYEVRLKYSHKMFNFQNDNDKS